MVLAEVERYAREIVPSFNAYAYFRIGYRLARRLAQLFYRVRLAYADDAGRAAIPVSAFEPAGRDLVFVPVGINYDRVIEDRSLVRGQDVEAARHPGAAGVARGDGASARRRGLAQRARA